MMSTEALTVSRLKSFRKCRRHHKLRYLDGIVPVKDSTPLRFGTIVHAGLEAWWKTGDMGNVLDAVAKVGRDGEAIEVAKAMEVLSRYPDAWPDRASYDVVAVEASWETPLPNPDAKNLATSRTFHLAGKIDVLLRRKATGALILVEHKTTSQDVSPESTYWKKLAMDTQLSLYVLGVEALGHGKVDAIIYDVLKTPGQELKLATPVELRKYTQAKAGQPSRLYANQRETDETVEELAQRVGADIDEDRSKYFGRREVVRLDDELYEAVLDTWQDAKEMIAAKAAGRAPRNPDACSIYGTCEFYDICAFGVDPDQSPSFRRLGSVNPELASSATAAETSLTMEV